MDRWLDRRSDAIWRQLERETELLSVNNRSLWDSEWSRMWTSAWDYDNIYMWYDPNIGIWNWTDGNKGNTLV